MTISLRPEENPNCLPNVWEKSVYDLNFEECKAMGILGVIFDHDCSLISARDRVLPKRSIQLIRNLKSMKLKVVIVSNTGPLKPMIDRVAENAKLVGVNCVVCKTNDEYKPAPWGFAVGARIMGLPHCKILVVGDQIKNDICGGNAAGMNTALVQKMGHDSIWLSITGYPQYKRLRERPAWQYIKSNRHRGLWYPKL